MEGPPKEFWEQLGEGCGCFLLMVGFGLFIALISIEKIIVALKG